MIPFPSIILSTTDGSQGAALVAQSAAELSQKTGAELHLVYVGPHLPMPLIATDEELVRRRRCEARKKLDKEVERLRAAGREVKEAHLRFGDEDQQIITLAKEIGADRQVHCAVLVVRSKGEAS